MNGIKEAFAELKKLDAQAELLEKVEPANKQFIQNAQEGKIKAKIVKNGEVPYQLSDAWMRGEID